MPLATGVDIIKIKRIRKAIDRHGERFLQRVYTPTELAEARNNPASLAARFAAKEAVAKALGCGIGPVSWQEIEIRRDAANRPYLLLYHAASQLALEQGITTWSISLSHTRKYALAFVVGSSDEK
jgi:holo-[acyl-carrier protein] synthase